MTVEQVMLKLASCGSDQTKRIYMSHGAKEPLFRVKIGDMKKLLKKVILNNELALELFDTGNTDARYFAALSADEKRMTKRDMRKWARVENWHMLSEYAVAQLKWFQLFPESPALGTPRLGRSLELDEGERVIAIHRNDELVLYGVVTH